MILRPAAPAVRLGLGANAPQFALLVLVNAFVGGMVGLERTVLPLLAEHEFGLASASAALSFIASFGATKAIANLAAGMLSDRVGRKPLLVLGWVLGLPVAPMVMLAPTWEWIVAANVLLGLNQGLCWSTTVFMKIDLAGPARRGLAMGLNEAAGYGAVAAAAAVSGYVAASAGLRPAPFYLGIGFAAAGLLLSVFLVRETHGHANREAALDTFNSGADAGLPFRTVAALTSWRDRSLSSSSQAGLVNNLNDGIAWGLLPLHFAAAGLPLDSIAFLVALYPAIWAVAQLGTGALSDHVGRKPLIVLGMFLQAGAFALLAMTRGLEPWAAAMALLGLGTAFVYPTLVAAISDVAHPTWRASALGVYRLWRDGGYVVGALAGGALADAFGVPFSLGATGGLTLASGGLVLARMRETAPLARSRPARA